MWLTVFKKLWPLLLAGAVGYAIYHYGYKYGSLKVQAEWNVAKLAEREAHDQLVRQLARQEAAHQAESSRISDALVQAHQDHRDALSNLRAAYERRLLLSSDRAEVYRRQAEAGAASCGDLAGHAAELDRALEEGRHLVRELGSTLGLRDQQVIRLGQQITNDRNLIAGDSNGK